MWCIQAMRGSNTVALGYDEGSVTIKLGREEPAVSMDSSGKILWAKHSEIQQANLKTLDPALVEQLQGRRFFHSLHHFRNILRFIAGFPFKSFRVGFSKRHFFIT